MRALLAVGINIFLRGQLQDGINPGNRPSAVADFRTTEGILPVVGYGFPACACRLCVRSIYSANMSVTRS